MKKLFFIGALILTSLTSFSQNYYRSIVTTGSYNIKNSWEQSNDSIIWISAVAYPNNNTRSVIIQSGHTITQSSTPSSLTISIKNLTVNGIFISSNSKSLTINGKLTVNGTFTEGTADVIINKDFINNGTFTSSILNTNISGNYINNGTIINNGIVNFVGSTDNDISGTSTTSFYYLKIDKSANSTVNIASTVELQELLSFGTSATNTLNISTGSFTFLSINGQTAHIDVLSSPLPVMTGNYIFQRYFPAQPGRYNFMFGVPVSSATVSMFQPTTFDGSGYPTNGIWITGSFTGSNNGAVSGLGSAASLFRYDPNTGLYGAYPTTNNSATFNQGEGYRFSVRDGGSSVLTTVAKTLSVSGTPYLGDFTFSNIVNVAGTKPFASGALPGILPPITGGWNLIANPYASDISINVADTSIGTGTWSKYHVSNTSYIYDAATKNFKPCAAGVPDSNCFISSFQGFWVQANGASPSLTVLETAKITDQNTLNNLRTSKESLNYLGIKIVSSDNNTNKTYIRFVNGSTLKNDTYDGFKLGVNGESSVSTTTIYTQYDSVFYDVNSKPFIFNTDTSEINIVSPNGNTTLNFSDINNLNNGYSLTLFDKFTNTSTDVNSNPNYTFDVSDDKNSKGNRFQLIVGNKTTNTVDSKLDNTLSVSPNPFKNRLTINTKFEGDINVTITDILGNTVYKGTDRSFNPNVSDGIYFIKVLYDNKVFSDKLIK